MNIHLEQTPTGKNKRKYKFRLRAYQNDGLMESNKKPIQQLPPKTSAAHTEESPMHVLFPTDR